MRNGISAGPLPADLLYGSEIATACLPGPGFSPLVAYAIAFRETIRGQIDGQWCASDVMSQNGDGGHGLCQVTPEDWWPHAMSSEWASLNWKDPVLNTAFAVKWFMIPAETYWAGQGLQGDGLIKCIADEFNAGRDAVIASHAKGNADLASTGGDYGSDILSNYGLLDAGLHPR